MLTSLEELGLVEREVVEEDHRCRHVVLTKAGRRCVFRAARLLIHSGNVQLMVDSALSPDRWHEPTACRLASDPFDRSLYLLRHAYGDVATVHYPRADAKDGFARPLVWYGTDEAAPL
jgi:DNA-binding MarR family transcriptional regulator